MAELCYVLTSLDLSASIDTSEPSRLYPITMVAFSVLRPTMLALGLTLGLPAILYFSILGALVVAPSLQAHAIYLHKVALTWFKDLNTPEQFGFAHHQVTPFYISTPDGVKLHTWHVLPLAAYESHQEELLAQGPDGGL